MKNKLQLILVLLLMLSSLQLYADEIHEAAKKGDMARVKAILKKSPGMINKVDKDRRTLLNRAFTDKNKPLVIFLIKNGADINKKDEYLNFENRRDRLVGVVDFPIHYAVLNNWKDVTGLLLDKGADINGRNIFGLTPLCIAIYNGNEDMFKYLLSRGANVNVIAEGMTTLCMAAESGNREIVRELLEKGITTKALKQPPSSDHYT